MPSHDGAHAAHRGPRAGRPARPVHGVNGAVLVDRACPRPGAGRPVPRRVGVGGARRRRGRGVGRRGAGGAAGPPAPGRCPAHARRGGPAMTGPATRPPRSDRTALVAGLVTVTLWGSAFVAIRDAGHSLSPGPLALGRLLVALVVCAAVAASRREPLPAARDLP